jgi:hypothetical protein
MRRALALVLSAAIVTVPTVALAASADEKTYVVTGQVGGPTPPSDKRLLARERAKHARKRGANATTSVVVPPHLQAIAACESGGNPRAIGGGGMYRGKYQFSPATWAAVGGHGDPATASEAEQDRRATLLYARAGAAQWPVCGR